MKKLLLCLMLLAAFNAESKDFEYGGLWYRVISSTEHTCGVIQKYDSTGALIVYEGVVNIPSTVVSEGESYNVTTVEMNAFAKSKVTEVDIPAGVLEIKNTAFMNCLTLKKVTIGKDVNNIGLRIRKSTVEYQDNSAFMGCSALQEINVNLDNEVYSSVNGILYNKKGNELYCYPAGKECEKYVIPESVKFIRNDAFDGVKMGELDFNGFSNLQPFIFYGSTIEKLVIPSYISSLPGGIFGTVNYCIIENGSTTLGLSYNYDWACWPFKSIPKIEIYREVVGSTSWSNVSGQCPFKGGGLWSVLCDFEEIQDDLFYGTYCSKIVLGDRVKIIGDRTFSKCYLESIVFPSGLQKIGASSFKDCSEMTSVIFNETLKEIGEYAFANTHIEEVELPSSIEKIGTCAFATYDLRKVVCKSIIPPVIESKYVFGYNNDNLSRIQVYVPASALNVYKNAEGWKDILNILPIPGSESIFLKESSIAITSGDSYKLIATTIPEDAKITWASSDVNCVTVDENGVICGLKGGNAIITATIYGSAKAECNVTVMQGATDLKFDTHKLILNVGEEHRMSATVLPENSVDKEITWSSSDNQIASVNADGVIIAVKAGVAMIKGLVNKTVTDSCKVSVVQPAEKVILPETLELFLGRTARLTATVLPDDVTDKTVTWSTSDASVATVDAEGNVTAVSVGEATITAACGDKSATCKVTVSPVLAESIALDKTELLLTIGATVKLMATVLPDDVTDKTVTWSTSEASVATVDTEGNVTAVSVGEATITAACGDKSATCKVTVSPVLAESIALDKTELSLTIGATVKLMATVLPDDVTDKTVTWSTSEASVATVDAEGNVTAVSVGEATITAACGDKSATCKVTVSPVLAESIALDKTELSLTIGASAKLTATVLPDDVTDKTIVWTTSDASVATVDAEGNVTAVSVGEATITAACGDKSATCKVTVSPVLAESIALDKTELSLTIGASAKLTATVLPDDVTDKTIVWTTSDASVATVDAEGNVTAVSVGEATITAACGDKSATCKVTVSPVLAESIALDKTELSLTIGATVKLMATVLPEDVTDKTVAWSTSDASVATVDVEGNVTAVSVGEATITAACGDKSATCKVTVSPVLAESIALDKTEISLTIGASAKLAATVLPENVTDKTVTWSTSDASVATVDAEGNVTAVSVGEATITAACGDKSATCKVTVNPVLAESIALDKTELSLTIGATVKLMATVLPDDVTDKTVTWSTSEASVATVDAEGNVTAVSVGEATITAACGDKSATCKVTVNPVLAESIALDKTELSLTIGASAKLTATVLPDDVTDKTIVWTTSDASVATVDAEGNVIAITTGKAIIKAACGEIYANCEVTVTQPTTGIAIVESDNISIIVDGSELRVIGVEPTDNVSIIRQDGAIVYSGANRESYSLVRGLYIVVVNNSTFKVVIN